MDKRKRWTTKEEARRYASKAFNEGRRGLSFWAACDYIGWTPTEVHNTKLFQGSIYADYLISEGKEYIEEEISSIKWEINTIQYSEDKNINASIKDLEDDLAIAQDELKYLNRRVHRY